MEKDSDEKVESEALDVVVTDLEADGQSLCSGLIVGRWVPDGESRLAAGAERPTGREEHKK